MCRPYVSVRKGSIHIVSTRASMHRRSASVNHRSVFYHALFLMECGNMKLLARIISGVGSCPYSDLETFGVLGLSSRHISVVPQGKLLLFHKHVDAPMHYKHWPSVQGFDHFGLAAVN
jgi:hypothetical protein